jgi:serine/threonine protein kinase
MVGQSIEQYRVDSLLGEGGMAAVYRVEHASLGSVHAMKVLRVSTPQTREALLHEGRCQARVHHPNVVAVTDILSIEGRPALVLEHVSGPTLEDWLERESRSLAALLSLFRGVVRGVEAIHAQQLIHGDLKPSNILLARTPEGLVPKVADFGLVHDLASAPKSAGQGTPGYSAPEWLEGSAEIDPRADLFSLGALLYRMLTGRPPFVGDAVEIGRQVREGRFVPPGVLMPTLPAWLGELVRRLLEADKDRRLRSCAELLEQLSPPLDELYGHTMSYDEVPTPVPVGPTPLPPRPRPRRAVGSLGLLGLGMIGGMGLALVLAPAAAPILSPDPSAPSKVRQVEVVEPALHESDLMIELPAPSPISVQVPAPGPPVADVPMGTLLFEGDGQISLVGPDGRRALPGRVPAGTWTWTSQFGAYPGPGGSLELPPGDTVVVRCSSFARHCRALTR